MNHIESVAAWLDVRYPGWAYQIDLDTFNIHSSTRCVGGQLGVSWRELAQQYREDTGYRHVGDGVLACGQTIWYDEIKRRQAVPVKKPSPILAGLASLAGLAIL